MLDVHNVAVDRQSVSSPWHWDPLRLMTKF